MMSVRRLFQCVMLVALMLAPISMIGGGAMAMPSATATTPDTGHCAEMGGQQDQDHDRAKVDCRMACAGVLAEVQGIVETTAVVMTPKTMVLPAVAPRSNPTAELRPPRLA